MAGLDESTTRSHGFTINATLVRTPQALARIDTVVLDEGRDVRTLNDAAVAPAGIVTLDTVGAATAASLLEIETTMTAGAAHSRTFY